MNLDGISGNLISIHVKFPSFLDSIPVYMYYIEKYVKSTDHPLDLHFSIDHGYMW